MKRPPAGRYLETSTAGEKVKSFVPAELPPSLEIDAVLREGLDRALLSLGKLSASASFLPDTNLLLYLYVRKEAVLSSQIEGTQSSLSDLLLYEIEETPGVLSDDAAEVSRYVAAVNHGIERMNGGFPLSNRLIREMHGILLSSGRGSAKDPGEFRRSQNWIGGTRPGNAVFVPPPAELVPDCMGGLELFLHDAKGRTPALLKAALAHVQFETIHPFLDGNGRIGRLLIPLVLCEEKVLDIPILYLSLYFKNHRDEYYDLLQRVRLEGDWEAWIDFFAKAVRETADQCTAAALRISGLVREYGKRLQDLGRLAGSAAIVLRELQARPVATAASMCRAAGLVPNTATKVFRALAEAGMVREVTGRRRNRVYVYGKLMDILNEGTEPL